MGPFLPVSAPAEPLLPPPDKTGGLPPGCSVIRTHYRDPTSLPMQHVMLANQGDPKEQDTEEPKASAILRPGTERWASIVASCMLNISCVLSSVPCLNPVNLARLVFLPPLFNEDRIKAQRGQGTCPGSHSKSQGRI